MDEKVRVFIDEKKNEKLISMGLIKEIKREYGPYSMKYSKYERETKQYYCEVPVPIEMTDEEFEKVCRYAEIEVNEPPQKDANEKTNLKNAAEKTLGTFNTIVLIIGLLLAFICVIAGIVINIEQSWILVLSGIIIIIPFILSWAVLKVYLNISNNLHEINSKIK